MERTSILTDLRICPAANFGLLSLDDGLPDVASLDSFFTSVPLVLEQGEFTERTVDHPQGELLERSIKASIPRDSDFHLLFTSKRIVAYFETSNGERELWGTNVNPLSYGYDRGSGSGNADTRNTGLEMRYTVPV